MKPTTKPTARAGTLLVAALVLYFFANQTQVGWLYVMAAVMGGCVLAAAWLNRAMLRSVMASRSIRLTTPAAFPGAKGATARIADAIHEGDRVEVMLRLRAGKSTAQVTLTEVCPLTSDAQLRTQALYIPMLSRSAIIEHSYDVDVTQRGIHRFDPLKATSHAPFGIFARQGTITADAALLVYPEVRPLRRLELLDRRQTLQQLRARAGHGSEIIGTRPYRPGDSPRHIHWRSSARQQSLISKEFADDAQPALLLTLDCFAHPYPTATAFETSVKIATAVGEYALRSGYRVELLANEHTDPKAAHMPHEETWHTLLERLARVLPRGTQHLADLLQKPSQAQVAAVLPYPDLTCAAHLSRLRAAGIQVLAIVVSDAQDEDCAAVAARLRSAGVDTRIVQPGDDWENTLAASAAYPTASKANTRAEIAAP